MTNTSSALEDLEEVVEELAEDICKADGAAMLLRRLSAEVNDQELQFVVDQLPRVIGGMVEKHDRMEELLADISGSAAEAEAAARPMQQTLGMRYGLMGALALREGRTERAVKATEEEVAELLDQLLTARPELVTPAEAETSDEDAAWEEALAHRLMTLDPQAPGACLAKLCYGVLRSCDGSPATFALDFVHAAIEDERLATRLLAQGMIALMHREAASPVVAVLEKHYKALEPLRQESRKARRAAAAIAAE